MRARQFFNRMHHFESRTTTVLFIVRIGLATYLAWSGYLLLSTELFFGAGFIALGALLVLGILRRIIALIAFIALILQFTILGTINPAIAMAALIAIALLIGPSR